MSLRLDEDRIAHRIDTGRRGGRENAEILLVRPQRHDRQQVRVRQRTAADKRQSDHSPVSSIILCYNISVNNNITPAANSLRLASYRRGPTLALPVRERPDPGDSEGLAPRRKSTVQ